VMGKWMVTFAAGTALVGSGLCVAQAVADPTAATPPAISGSAVYGSKLTCDNGTWSSGAGSFTYAWELADGNLVVASGQTVTVRAAWVGLAIQCAVTAKDTTGTSTAASSAVTARASTPKITLTKARQTAAGKVTFQGKISPTASLAGGSGSLILYRKTSSGPEQLSFNGGQTRPNLKSGAFTLVASRQPRGKHAYVIQYVPSALGYAQVLVGRTITVTAS
jgi:endo-1,4-beta-xylanase